MKNKIEPILVISDKDIIELKHLYCDPKNITAQNDYEKWYRNERTFFTKKGSVIFDHQAEGRELPDRFIINFDFRKPGVAFFSYSTDKEREIISSWEIKMDSKAELMEQPKIVFFSLKRFMNAFGNDEKKEDPHLTRIKALSKENLNRQKHLTATGISHFKSEKGQEYIGYKIQEKLIENHVKQQKKLNIPIENAEKIKIINQKICDAHSARILLLMYHISNQQPEEITIEFQNKIAAERKLTNSKYKYYGYVNLNAKVYKAKIDHDNNGNPRPFTRHIESWGVRGHYRHYRSGKKIWVAEYKKGSGEIEKRIYGMNDQVPEDIQPQVFEIMRYVSANKQVKAIPEENRLYILNPHGKPIAALRIKP